MNHIRIIIIRVNGLELVFFSGASVDPSWTLETSDAIFNDSLGRALDGAGRRFEPRRG